VTNSASQEPEAALAFVAAAMSSQGRLTLVERRTHAGESLRQSEMTLRRS
jgi:hypothetical protein